MSTRAMTIRSSAAGERPPAAALRSFRRPRVSAAVRAGSMRRRERPGPESATAARTTLRRPPAGRRSRSAPRCRARARDDWARRPHGSTPEFSGTSLGGGHPTRVDRGIGRSLTRKAAAGIPGLPGNRKILGQAVGPATAENAVDPMAVDTTVVGERGTGAIRASDRRPGSLARARPPPRPSRALCADRGATRLFAPRNRRNWAVSRPLGSPWSLPSSSSTPRPPP